MEQGAYSHSDRAGSLSPANAIGSVQANSPNQVGQRGSATRCGTRPTTTHAQPPSLYIGEATRVGDRCVPGLDLADRLHSALSQGLAAVGEHPHHLEVGVDLHIRRWAVRTATTATEWPSRASVFRL
jgi:hypothetical protein